jgi:hypothetical protein
MGMGEGEHIPFDPTRDGSIYPPHSDARRGVLLDGFETSSFRAATTPT